jgi:hypothetical protein
VNAVPRRVHQRWRRDVSGVGARDWLLLELELLLDDAGAVDSWSLRARLELAGGKPYVREGLSSYGSVALAHTFGNRFGLSGDLRVDLTGDAILIWAELQYGYAGLPPQIFLGVLAEFPLVPPRRPPPSDGDDEACAAEPPAGDGGDPRLPIIAPLPAEPGAEPSWDPFTDPSFDPSGDAGREVEGQRDADVDLFPYTYMRGWPEPAREQIDRRFSFYPYPIDGAPTGQLLQQLAAVRRQGRPDAREAMRELAVRHLDGELGDDAPFLDRVDGLSAPIPSYPFVYALLAEPERGAPADRLAEIWRVLGMNAAQTASVLQSSSHQRDVARLWQSYLALVVELGFDRRGRARLGQVLVVEHALGWLTRASAAAPSQAELDALAAAVLVLPEEIFPLPAEQSSPPMASPPEPLADREHPGAIVPYAIGELMMVKHALRGYALGELASVESIRAGERRELRRRQLDRTVEASVEARANDRSEERDDGSSSSSLTSEVLGTMADTITTTTYNGFGTSYGPPTTATLNGGWSVEQKPAGNPSKEDLTRFAGEVLSKTVRRISHRVAEVRSRSSLRDSEETATSVVDNARGAKNLRAVYRWLEQVYGARVVNYGHRLLVEMILEAPAAHFLRAERRPACLDQAPPISPEARNIASFEDITAQNFALLVSRYPSDELELPPPEIETDPTSRAVAAWQLRTFLAIHRSYAAQRLASERALAPDAICPSSTVEPRPRLSLRAIERRELKHGAIELLLAQLQQRQGGAAGPETGPLPSELERSRPRYLRFFETVFEWREMTYAFLCERAAAPSAAQPRDPSPAALARRFGDDLRFLEFLEASHARLLVPVTLEKAQALLFFLSSGALWDVAEPTRSSRRRHGGPCAPAPAPLPVHAADVALVNELLSAARASHPSHPRLVSELPSIRVPTSIAVLTDGDLPLLGAASPAAGAAAPRGAP